MATQRHLHECRPDVLTAVAVAVPVPTPSAHSMAAMRAAPRSPDVPERSMHSMHVEEHKSALGGTTERHLSPSQALPPGCSAATPLSTRCVNAYSMWVDKAGPGPVHCTAPPSPPGLSGGSWSGMHAEELPQGFITSRHSSCTDGHTALSSDLSCSAAQYR